MRALRQAFRYIYFRIIRIPKFNLFLSRIPDKYQNLSKFYYYGIFNSEERELSKKIESFRSKIPSLFAEKKRIGSFQSPHSGTFEKDEKGHSKSGKFIDNDIRAHLNTGTDRRKGILLRRIVNGLDIKRVLEFGTNTGFSGAYFTSVNQTNLVSVEGSQDLCDIAKINIELI